MAGELIDKYLTENNDKAYENLFKRCIIALEDFKKDIVSHNTWRYDKPEDIKKFYAELRKAKGHIDDAIRVIMVGNHRYE